MRERRASGRTSVATKEPASLKKTGGRRAMTLQPDGPINGGGMASGKAVGAVVGAITILRYLAKAREPVGVSRIAKETKLNTSTTFNIIRTLMLYDFVQFDQLSKTYRLSLGILDIARAATAVGGDFNVIQPLMEQMANTHGVTMTLWQPAKRDRKVLIIAAHTRNAMRIQMAVGQVLPLLTGGTGRLFAAFSDLSDKEIRKQFDAIRWDGPLSFADFQGQVDEAKKKGWAIDQGNFAVGTVQISIPIFDRDNRVVMAATATMFAGQYNPEKAAEIVRDLSAFSEQAARIISA